MPKSSSNLKHICSTRHHAANASSSGSSSSSSTTTSRDTATAGMGTTSVWAGEEAYLVERATQVRFDFWRLIDQPIIQHHPPGMRRCCAYLQVPVVNAVGYGYDDVDEWYAVATGDTEGHIYSRNTNPTVRALEQKVQVRTTCVQL
jgi:cystathionine beta-lyase/cystathionine gamma-synthase